MQRMKFFPFLSHSAHTRHVFRTIPRLQSSPWTHRFAVDPLCRSGTDSQQFVKDMLESSGLHTRSGHFAFGMGCCRGAVCVYMFFVPNFLCVAPSRLNGCRVMVMAHIPMVPLTDLLLVCLLLPVCTWRILMFGTLDIKRMGVVRCITSCVGDEIFFFTVSVPFHSQHIVHKTGRSFRSLAARQ